MLPTLAGLLMQLISHQEMQDRHPPAGIPGDGPPHGWPAFVW